MFELCKPDEHGTWDLESVPEWEVLTEESLCGTYDVQLPTTGVRFGRADAATERTEP